MSICISHLGCHTLWLSSRRCTSSSCLRSTCRNAGGCEMLTIEAAAASILSPVTSAHQSSSKYQRFQQYQYQQIAQIQTEDLQKAQDKKKTKTQNTNELNCKRLVYCMCVCSSSRRCAIPVAIYTYIYISSLRNNVHLTVASLSTDHLFGHVYRHLARGTGQCVPRGIKPATSTRIFRITIEICFDNFVLCHNRGHQNRCSQRE